MPGGFTTWLEALSNLKSLEIRTRYNSLQLEHDLPGLRNLTQLSSLVLEATPGSDGIWDQSVLMPLTCLTALRYLEITVLQMWNKAMPLPRQLTILTGLTNLKLARENRDEDHDSDQAYSNEQTMDVVCELSGLQRLELAGLMATCPPQLSKLQGLSHLMVHEFGDEWPACMILSSLCECSSLVSVTLSSLSSTTSDVWPEVCLALQRLPHLKALSFEDNFFFSLVELNNWAFPSQLTRLSLRHSNLEVLLPALTGLTSLQELNLADNAFPQLLPGPYLSGLKVLDLSTFLEAFPHALQEAMSLENLVLCHAFAWQLWWNARRLKGAISVHCNFIFKCTSSRGKVETFSWGETCASASAPQD